MTVFLVWSGAPVPDGLPGPWLEILAVGPGLAVVESEESLSRVYHEVKWSLPDGTPLIVSPLTTRPKLKGLAPGTQTWLGDRLPARSHDQDPPRVRRVPAAVDDPTGEPVVGGER
jgi:hypothetical protein